MSRTIIVLSRLTEDRIAATFLNDLTAPKPYIVTTYQGSDRPPVSCTVADIPPVGKVHVLVKDDAHG